MDASGRDPRERVAAWLLVILLVLHVWVGSLGWGSTGLPHNGFREAQTAISAYFIQQEGNFSLAYPTPVLGPPWSIPMEFPLYQWTVVALSNVSGLDLPMAGRLVGLLCFYLTLPAFLLAFARLGFARWQRLLLLAAIVSCPLYLFYARAFLIETMALMFSAWFFVGYVLTGETRRPAWFALALGAGVLAALVKVTTFLFFLMPAAAWTLWWVWGDVRQPGGGGVRSVVRRALWCAPAGLLPIAVALAWVSYADAVKGAAFSGAFLQSENLRDFNYGFGRRFAADIWGQHVDIWFAELMAWPVLLAVTALGAFLGRERWRLLVVLLTCFMAVQVVFPLLYAFHAYYYVANAWTLMMAVGLVAVGLVESRLPRSVSWALVIALFGVQVATVFVRHGRDMIEEEPGSIQMIENLRLATAPNDVLVVAGDDWSSVIPYNTGRRALMLRTGVESDRAYLEKAFATLADYQVGALVLCGDQRFNAGLVGLARDRLGIDSRQAFSWGTIDVYLAQGKRDRFVDGLLDTLDWPEISVNEWQTHLVGREVAWEEVPRRARPLFAGLEPLPVRYFTGAPLARYEQDKRSFFDAQPSKRLVFSLPAGAHVFTCEIGILPGAYAEEIPHGDRTDGIRVSLSASAAPGSPAERFYTQEINPRDRYDQRGLMKLRHTFTLAAPGEVIFEVDAGPHNNAARDWTIMGPLRIRPATEP